MRSAEMLLAWTRGLIPNAKREEFDRQGHFGKLLEGRKLWGIFQHHDGMTGTARKHVVVVSFMAFNCTNGVLTCHAGLRPHVAHSSMECQHGDARRIADIAQQTRRITNSFTARQ
jgi:hypothetical protein